MNANEARTLFLRELGYIIEIDDNGTHVARETLDEWQTKQFKSD